MKKDVAIDWCVAALMVSELGDDAALSRLWDRAFEAGKRKGLETGYSFGFFDGTDRVRSPKTNPYAVDTPDE